MKRKRRKKGGKIVSTKREPLSLLQVRIGENEMHFKKELTKNILAFLVGKGIIECDFDEIPCNVRVEDRYMYVNIGGIQPPNPNAAMLKNHMIVIREKGLREAYFKRYKATYYMSVIDPHPEHFKIAIDLQSQRLNVAVSKSLLDVLE